MEMGSLIQENLALYFLLTTVFNSNSIPLHVASNQVAACFGSSLDCQKWLRLYIQLCMSWLL